MGKGLPRYIRNVSSSMYSIVPVTDSGVSEDAYESGLSCLMGLFVDERVSLRFYRGTELLNSVRGRVIRGKRGHGLHEDYVGTVPNVEGTLAGARKSRIRVNGRMETFDRIELCVLGKRKPYKTE